ncbi:MAG: tetratricopeptide repeat protein [Bryobacteraceae bacterium]|nr:tetratricopeptide repeat protein [Bryobacteraceae bacterium]
MTSMTSGDNEDLLARAEARFSAGLVTESLRDIVQFLSRHPDAAAAALALYKRLQTTNNPPFARLALEAGLTVAPRSVPLLIKASIYDVNKGRIDSGYRLAEQALALAPENGEAWSTLAVACGFMGDYAQAVARLQQALRLSPQSASVIWRNLGWLHSTFGNGPHSTEAYHRAITSGAVVSPEVHSSFLLSLRYWPSGSEDQIFNAYQQWGQSVSEALRHHHAERGSFAPKVPHQRVRLGYLSADFREHSVMYFLEPVLANHDREKFEIYCYDDGSRHDSMTDRIRTHADQWRDIRGLNLGPALSRLREDKLDILIDLSGHMMGNRLAVFASRAAFLQGSWLGCPGTTGLRAMDFKLVDALTDLPVISDRWHTEKLVRLPSTFCVYQPPDADALPSAPPSAVNGYITFGSFNNPCKISDLTLHAWSKVMQSVSGARLRLKGPGFDRPLMQATWRQRLAGFDIPSDRVECLGKTDTTLGHLETYHDIDIALDTLPYNGVTTTCEALWMGVPVVTCWGEGHAARTGGSLLSSTGLQSLVGQTPEDFVRIAVDLAHDADRLRTLHAELRATMRASPLMNYSTFTREVEATFTALLDDAREKQVRSLPTQSG